MSDSGVRLQLRLGDEKPSLAPAEVMEALLDLKVTNKDRERDGFEMKFSLGRNVRGSYGLLDSGLLNPEKRAVIVLIVRAFSQVLIDGFITQLQFIPSNRPGESTLLVTGEDLGIKLDTINPKKPHPQQTDSEIVESVLGKYKKYFEAKVTVTQEKPSVSERVPSQRETDLQFIRRLAQRNGFIFYIEPATPEKSTAYWGPENRRDTQQPDLTMNMGAYTNLEASPTIRFNALGPAKPEAKSLDLQKKSTAPASAAGDEPQALSRDPAKPLRTMQLCNTAHLSNSQAGLQARTAGIDTANAVTVNGEIDTVRYGSVLRSRRLVNLRGVGAVHSGLYYVQEVVHQINRGLYKQTFTLTREGLGPRENKTPPAQENRGALLKFTA
ncbi:MAG: phage late control D family protein [bacterium]